jgi:SagB-type dehydrogenase family enzyme
MTGMPRGDRGGNGLRMRRVDFASLLLAAALGAPSCVGGGEGRTGQPLAVAPLPMPETSGGMPLAVALGRRRSQRAFDPGALTPAQTGQLLWAAQGITDPLGHRTAPSAGALYPLELYICTGATVAHYQPVDHALAVLSREDRRASLQKAALGQDAVGAAPLLVVVTAVYARSERRYGSRGQRFAQLEAGHAAQNVLLTATSLGLGAVPIGAFDDGGVRAALELPSDRTPLYMIAVGAFPAV